MKENGLYTEQSPKTQITIPEEILQHIERGEVGQIARGRINDPFQEIRLEVYGVPNGTLGTRIIAVNSAFLGDATPPEHMAAARNDIILTLHKLAKSNASDYKLFGASAEWQLDGRTVHLSVPMQGPQEFHISIGSTEIGAATTAGNSHPRYEKTQIKLDGLTPDREAIEGSITTLFNVSST